MSYFQRYSKTCALSISIFVGMNYTALSVHPLAERVIKVINTEGQMALCKKGGIFRESVGLKAGKNCENHDFAKFAYAACGQDADFQTSHCFNIIKKNLGGKSILGSPAAIENEVKIKATNTYAMVCTTKREKLAGILKAIADRSCDSKASNMPATSGLTMVQKQNFKAIIDKQLKVVEATKSWISAKPSSTAVGNSGKITFGAQRGSPASTPQSVNNKSLLELAQKLTRELKDLNKVLENVEPQKETIIAANFEKLDQLSISKDLSLEEMQKRLQIMDQILKNMD